MTSTDEIPIPEESTHWTRRRRRRVTFLAGTCAIAVVLAGVANASTRPSHDSGAAADTPNPTTRSTTTTTTTTTQRATTTPSIMTPTSTTSGSLLGDAPSNATIAQGPAPLAGPSDLTGTITLASTTLVAARDIPVSLTVRNVSNHAVSLTDDAGVGVEIGVDLATADPDAGADTRPDFEKHPGEQILPPGGERTLTITIPTIPEAVGPATISAWFLRGVVMQSFLAPSYSLPGVPSVAVNVVPPGTESGTPVDPSLGAWQATMSADASFVRVGESIEIRASVTNVGNELQNTAGYGSLSIGCIRRSWSHTPEAEFGERIGSLTLAPGQTHSFSLELRPPDWWHLPVFECWLGMTFHPGDRQSTYRRYNVHSDTVDIASLPVATTTTTASATTTTVTTR